MPKEINSRRRDFARMAAGALVAAQFEVLRSAQAQNPSSTTPSIPRIKPGANTSFTSIKQVNAGLLNIGYAEVGPADGPPVMLLHGWPYDIHSFVDVAPALSAGDTG